MQTSFIIKGIPLQEISHLFELDEETLNSIGAQLLTVYEKPGFPCRVSLVDAEIGERVLAMNFEHHNVNSFYKASDPVFIRMHAKENQLAPNEIPLMLIHRTLSLRIYDKNAMMIAAQITIGTELKEAIQQIFSNKEASYIQVHNAGPGCYNCQINRI